jgi:hypothetical protein
MLTDQLCDASGTLPALDFNADIVRTRASGAFFVIDLSWSKNSVEQEIKKYRLKSIIWAACL